MLMKSFPSDPAESKHKCLQTSHSLPALLRHIGLPCERPCADRWALCASKDTIKKKKKKVDRNAGVRSIRRGIIDAPALDTAKNRPLF